MTGAQLLNVRGKAELLLRLLAQKFGSLPAAARERIHQASAGEVEAWAERLLVAATVEEVMAGAGDPMRREYILQAGAEMLRNEFRDFAERIGPTALEAYVRAEEGMQVQGKAELLLRLLFRKFDTIPAAVRERIREASSDEVDAWAERLLVAATVKEVMAGVEVCK